MLNNINYKNSLVSIIIPSYNRYQLLISCVNSCINQTHKNIEIIIINDCSTDNRYYNGYLEKMDDRIKVIHLPINMRQKYNTSCAQGMTRQEGINIAKGEWIAFLDDDDIFLSFKIEKQLKYLEEYNYNNEIPILMCSSDMYYTDVLNIEKNDIKEIPNNIILNVRSYYSNKNIVLNLNGNSIITLDTINKHNFIPNSSVLIHKSITDKVKMKLCVYEDWNYWKDSLNFTNCLHILEPLFYYYINDTKYYSYLDINN